MKTSHKILNIIKNLLCGFKFRMKCKNCRELWKFLSLWTENSFCEHSASRHVKNSARNANCAFQIKELLWVSWVLWFVRFFFSFCFLLASQKNRHHHHCLAHMSDLIFFSIHVTKEWVFVFSRVKSLFVLSNLSQT